MLDVKGIPKLERLFRLAAQLDVDKSDLQRYTIHEFNRISAEIDLQPLVDYLAARPLLDLAYSDETDEELPRIFGGISVGLARTFKTLEPDLKNPQSKHWEQIPATMRAAAIDRFGGSEVLTLHVLPVPEIDPSEVLIAIQTAGVGSWDADMRDGWWPDRKRPSLPLVLGTDGSGTIAAVGSRVRRFAPGDTVYAYSFANPKGGFYAEYVAVAAEKVGRLPASLSLKEAGAVATTGLTALQGIDDVLHVKRGEAVVIHGASGGVGSLALQFAKMRGARVLATTSGRDGVALVRRLGADAAADSRRDDLKSAAIGFAPEGVDAVLALAGGKPLTQLLDAVRRGGRIAFPNGVEPAPRERRGVSVQAYDATPGVREFERLRRALETARLKVPIAASYPLDQAAKAHERLAKRHVLGKIVLRIRGR